ncbi:putative cell surface-anchored protein [Streptococcus equi subsp. zooepidemicus]|uniref:Putative cell surface-anchored protein n=1 Tax=Streptococcus equi subsp. zooepidemicus (strain H70) TaxID=553483 RepID=C0MET8_STRS7|nr:LPXTG cell wall anchor domain-containing protein [Streptococcus equi]MCD3465114.1 LPXTG cell wall anchor domain-containing protein [Streptococcus equi subsp. zooepidemicus]CAW97813.1 putative cell surface-anchored protein [Streptococcus equi subsp. zooepidemicus]
MKSCKSTLRKAAMAAMLAGAITTTGGVKANEYNGILDSGSSLKKQMADLFVKLGVTESGALIVSVDSNIEVEKKLKSIFKNADVADLKVLMGKLGEEGGDLEAYKKLLGEKVNLTRLLVDELKNRITSEESLKKEKSKLESDLTSARDKSAELLSELDEAYKVNEEEGAKNADLANKLSAAQAEVERLGQAVDSLGRLTNSAKRELTEKLAEIEQLTQDKAKADADLEAANANITTLQEELVDVKADVDKLSEEKAAADQALAEANARVSNLEQEIVAANNRVADLEAQLAEKTAELDMVKADKAELEAKVKELQSLLEQKDHNNADLQAEIKRLKQELADKFKDLSQPRAKTPQASNSVAKQKASRPAAKPAGQLPSTGEDAANPFFTAAAVAIMTGAGLVTVMPKRQKD